MAYVSIEQTIEQTFANYIASFAGVGGSSLDASIPVASRLNVSSGGYLLLDQDKGRGPLVRTKYLNDKREIQEAGDGNDGVGSFISLSNVKIVGLTGGYSDKNAAHSEARTLSNIILKHLQRIPLSVVRQMNCVETGASGVTQYVTDVMYVGRDYPGADDSIVAPTKGTAPVISALVPGGSNTSTGTISINALATYSGPALANYTITIVSGNVGGHEGTLTGVTWNWFKNGGSPSSAIAASSTAYQNLDSGVQIKFVVGAGVTFVTGDTWTLSASPSGQGYTALFTQDWQLRVINQFL